ncbi:MAG TPA: cytochrome c3 family protein, partial [Mycobacterium sp.]|nr:cytochrome c3 family protein [Mycobacterium sp.]
MNCKQLATSVLLSTVALGGRAFAINQAPHDPGHSVTCNDCHIPFGGLSDASHLSSGTATSGSTLTLVDGSKTFTTGAWAGGIITFTAGANNGQFRTISANDATSISWTDPLPNVVVSGDGYSLNMVTYDDIEVKCKTCHSPTGVASATPTGGLHNTGVHNAPIGCGKCHEPHNIDPNSGWSGGAAVDGGAPGANLIRTDIRRPDGTKGTIVYSPGVFVQPGGNGVCQTCHTTTPYYRNDGTLQTHHVGESCMSCHTHEQQFFVDMTTGSDDGTGDHYDTTSQAYTDHTASGACVRCHTNGGFQDYVGATGAAMNLNDTFLAEGTAYPSGPMTCQTCHNSASDPTVAASGLTSVEFVSLKRVDGLDKATGLCSQCHQGRESTASVNSKITGAVATASKGLGIVTVTASAAGTTTTILAKTTMSASQYKGYTLVATNNANQGQKVLVADNTVGSNSAAGTITLATALGAATNGAVTGPPAIPADTFTLWPTATGGGSDTFTGIRMGDQSVRRGTTLVDTSRAWTANQWANFYLFVQTDPNPGSPNAGLYRLITGNDATSLTVASATLSSGMPFPAPIVAGTRYEILVKEDTSVLDAVAASISFSNSHYLPASAILHGNDAMIGYQNPRNLANVAVVQTSTSTSTSTSTALGTGTQTGTVTITTTSTSTNVITPNVAASPSYSSKNLHGVSQDSCTSCHSPHTLDVQVDATTCGRCHFKDDGSPVASLADLAASRQFGFDGDIDGDGNASEGLKDEIDGLAALLYTAIQKYATVKAGKAICYLASTNPYWFIDTDGSSGFCSAAEADPCNVFSSVTSS